MDTYPDINDINSYYQSNNQINSQQQQPNEVTKLKIINEDYYRNSIKFLTCYNSNCRHLLLDPLMCSNCEEVYCNNCVNKMKKNKSLCANVQNCKSGNIVFKEVSLSVKRAINSLEIKCKYGCIVPALSYLQHITLCELENNRQKCWICHKPANENKIKHKVDFQSKKNELINLCNNNQTQIKELNIERFMLEQEYSQLEAMVNKLTEIQIGNIESVFNLREDDRKMIINWIEVEYNKKPIIKLLFRASVNGYSAKSFHDICDDLQTKTLVLALTNANKIIGGFNVNPWTSPKDKAQLLKDHRYKTFLFSVSMQEKFKLKKDAYAISNDSKKGPIFGTYDLLIKDNCQSEDCANNDIGNCYYFTKSALDFYGKIPFRIVDYEVFSVEF